jgi:hypothetical protein
MAEGTSTFSHKNYLIYEGPVAKVTPAAEPENVSRPIACLLGRICMKNADGSISSSRHQANSSAPAGVNFT